MNANFGSSHSPQEIDLNITPIIDCFTVLITFLLASASFLSIGFFEASTPGKGASSAPLEPKTELVVRIKADRIAEFKKKGVKSGVSRFDLKRPETAKAISEELDQLKSTDVGLIQILVSADDDVPYQSLAEIMGHLNKTTLPVIVGDF
jgi:biopolymer transport protein ExbD